MTTFEKIAVDIAVELGANKMPIHQLLRMGRGAVIELDTNEDEDVKILANNIPVALGQVVLRGDKIAVSITEVLMRPLEARPPRNTNKI